MSAAPVGGRASSGDSTARLQGAAYGGGGCGVSSYGVNGKITEKEAFYGTYEVNADCTGTVHYTDGSKYDMYIAPDGSMFTFVQTNHRYAVTGTATRVGE